MGYKEIEMRIAVNSSEDDIKKTIGKKEQLSVFSYQILRKSLDARNKRNIVWQYRIGIDSKEIHRGIKPEYQTIEIPKKKYNKTCVIIGSGPAGIFSALVLAEAGIKVTLIERGSKVETRSNSIANFEKTGQFDPVNNYAFGEGGAGTFSDGKLTSRTKGISLERNYIYQKFVEAGAPDEINYMTHPHLGSDNLFVITSNLRKKLIDLGGEIIFENQLEDIIPQNTLIKKIKTSKGEIEADFFIAAIGHSATETYRMLINRNVPFQTKNFAIGMRAEHPQEIINKAQWGQVNLPGVKAAEYRLATTDNNDKPVYSFCMCPGGIIVPATAYANSNIVNGMSYFKRDGAYANAAVVAGIHVNELLEKEVHPLEAIDWLDELENKFYSYSNSYNAPAIKISDFIKQKSTQTLPLSSYPFKLISADINLLLPARIINTMRDGLIQFNNKLKDYDQGVLVGLESKTSSPVQVIRDKEKLNSFYNNFYLAGEGSGWAGGIISSAADGIKVALAILKKVN
jgi:uncharacterized protein